MHSSRRILNRSVVAFLSVAALMMGSLVAGTATASAPAGAAMAGTSLSHGSAGSSGNAAATSADGDVSKATWMHDLAPYIWYRRLSQIVIPGSHDSGSYSLTGQPFADYAVTQTEDLTAQLNDGARNFDLRVTYTRGRGGDDWYANHGFVQSDWLTWNTELNQLADWALAPGHEQEVILVHFAATASGDRFPSSDCQVLINRLGSALLTPNQLQAAYGTSDPGQVTLSQLWSMPGHPRVIMDNTQCLQGVGQSVGQWSDAATSGGGLLGGYYADQCYAAPYGDGKDGIEDPTLLALETRATAAGGDDNGHMMNLGPPKAGGFYNVGIEATPTQDCFLPLRWFDLDADKQVLAAVHYVFRADSAVGPNLNIVSGDFVQETDLVHDAIAMDETYPVQADSISRQGPETVTAEQDQPFADGSFAASVDYGNIPMDRAQVIYQVSYGGSPGQGPTVNGASSTVVPSTNGMVNLDGLGGTRPGTWKLTASAPYGGTEATWTLHVVPSTHYTLQPDTAFNASYVVPPRTTYPGPAVYAGGTTGNERRSAGHEEFVPVGLRAFAVNTQGHRVPGVEVTFDAAAAGGTFPGGAKTATVTTANEPDHPQDDGTATSPPFTAGTRSGTVSLLVSSPGAPTQALALTVAPADVSSDRFVPLSGDGQSTPVNTTFPIPLTGHIVDKFGNVVTRADMINEEFSDSLYMSLQRGGATWPDGSHGYAVPISAVTPDGIMTAPPLMAGNMVRPNTDHQGAGSNGVAIVVNPVGYGWWLGITPGPPGTVTTTGGDGQHTDTGKAFAQPLAVKVTDSAGNPIPGAPVTFQVTAGQATFPAPNLADLAKVRDDPEPPPNAPNPPPATVVVPADATGVATTPVLTAGNQPGPIEITASAGGPTAARTAVFHLAATGGPVPAAPTITTLTNGDGQVSVGFSTATPGTSPITTYTVDATDQSGPTAPPVTATGQASPIVVRGLTNGDAYVFTVSATSADGTSPPSAQSGRLNVGVVPVITSGPADGRLGQTYSSAFTISGAPAPAISTISGDLPPGLHLASDGTLTGIPTQAGSYEFTVRADNHVGTADDTVTVTISQ